MPELEMWSGMSIHFDEFQNQERLTLWAVRRMAVVLHQQRPEVVVGGDHSWAAIKSKVAAVGLDTSARAREVALNSSAGCNMKPVTKRADERERKDVRSERLKRPNRKCWANTTMLATMASITVGRFQRG